jgi:MinD-like ATPase involved in chromosome partitioning or flagellar assembly
VYPGSSVDQIAAALQHEYSRQIAVIGCAREVGTTTTAIALARSIASNARAVLVDLALTSPNIDVISDEPNAPGMAELMHGEASFGDIITKDRFSRLHLVAAGKVGDARELIESQMLQAAIGALAQSYDFVVLDAGAQTETSIAAIVAMAPRAVLVGGNTPPADLDAMADQMRSAGFADVSVLTGPPPSLDHAAEQSTAA